MYSIPKEKTGKKQNQRLFLNFGINKNKQITNERIASQSSTVHVQSFTVYTLLEYRPFEILPAVSRLTPLKKKLAFV